MLTPWDRPRKSSRHIRDRGRCSPHHGEHPMAVGGMDSGFPSRGYRSLEGTGKTRFAT